MTGKEQDLPHEKQPGVESTRSTNRELTSAIESGKKELVGDQKREIDRLKSGGRSGITNEFGKPVLFDNWEAKDSPVVAAQTRIDQGQFAERKPLSGEVSEEQGIDGVIAPGHSIKFTIGGGKLNFIQEGDWAPTQWAKQQDTLIAYLQSHPEAMNKLMAEIKKHGGAIEISSSAEPKPDSPQPKPHPEPGGGGTDRFQHFAGEGSINGRPVQIGRNGDVPIPANARDGYPVTVQTADGGETIRGHIATVHGQKCFYPDESIDAYGHRHLIKNPMNNLIPLHKVGAAAYEPYKGV